MILQALCHYYDRKSAAETGTLAPFGFEDKPIELILEIDKAGKLVQAITRNRKDKSSVCRVPRAVSRTAGVRANLLWDTAEYALGIDTRGKPDRVRDQHRAFINRLSEIPNDEGVDALRTFLVDFEPSDLEGQVNQDFLATNPNTSFRLIGDSHLICERWQLRSQVSEIAEAADEKQSCLVDGSLQAPKRLHATIKGVWGAQTSGARLVSFNLSAFNSFGGKQGLNAPVGERSSFKYTTALNHLLRTESSNRFQIGDASTVFWCEEPHPVEGAVFQVFGTGPQKTEDNPDEGTEAIHATFMSAYKGAASDNSSSRNFYVLGLSPNAARVSVRFWQVATVAQVAGRITRHFEDIQIARSDKQSAFLPLTKLLEATAAQGKAKNIPPNLEGGLLRAVFAGSRYPQPLLAAVLRRCTAEQRVRYAQAALIKACINRDIRHSSILAEEITVSLNPQSKHQSYQLGRLLAVLEKLQKDSAGGQLNATIRDRYFGAASSSPASVFGTLIKLSQHHLSKLGKESPRYATYAERSITDIVNQLPEADPFPANLPLAEQGRFMVGYYHQRHALYTKKTTDNKDEKTKGDDQ